MALPTESKERKEYPITTGVLDYFPNAIAEVARVSKQGNDQHNPGQPLHWSREKSADHADCIARHLVERGKLDVDGMRHSAKLAWRALANLQEELEQEAKGLEPFVLHTILTPEPLTGDERTAWEFENWLTRCNYAHPKCRTVSMMRWCIYWPEFDLQRQRSTGVPQ